MAGVFIPALNALLLAVMVWDLLGELFQAVEDWREGDTSAAMEHVLNVTKDLAVIGVTAVVWREASRAWAALDQWVPARLEDGSEALEWRPGAVSQRCTSRWGSGRCNGHLPCPGQKLDDHGRPQLRNRPARR